MKGPLLKFLKDWMLVIGMISGAGAYLVYMQIPSLHTAGPVLEFICRKAQPILLFLMLFISFSRIEPRQLVFKRWHLRNLLIQVLVFMILCLTVIWAMHSTTPLALWILRHRILFESAMLCMICPTATACAVVTGKLGGDMAQVVMYTIIINLAVSIVVPLTVPLLYPQAGISFIIAFSRILAKVFPLLILPCLTAWAVRWLMPRFHDWVASKMNLSFYLWSVSLTIAIVMSTRAIVHSGCSVLTLLGVALVSMLCCIIQFALGRVTGRKSGSRIEASQAFGQKNTVFGIWMGYTFWNPLVSVAGGFYTIWHNIHNTRQLYKTAKLILFLSAVLVISSCSRDEIENVEEQASPRKEWYQVVRTDTLKSESVVKYITGYPLPLGPDMVKVTFMYHSLNGSDTLALSGVVCWPVGMESSSRIWLENHYFTVRWDECPTQTPQPGMILSFSTNSIYVGADYQGLGLTRDMPQPYLNTILLGRQSLDCFMAAMAILKDIGPDLEQDYYTYNIGFSLGGAVSLAVARQIELDPALQKTVHLKKSFCGGGPYDQTAMFTSFFQDPNRELSYPIGLLAAARSMHMSNDSYLSKYDYSMLFSPTLIGNGVMDSLDLKKYNTYQIIDIMRKAGCSSLRNIFSEQVMDQESDVFRDVLKETRKLDLTIGWNPEIPILFHHSKKDETVPYVCLERVQENMSGNPNITYDIAESGSHADDARQFYTYLIFRRYDY